MLAHRKCLSSLISRSVRWQNMAWSKGVMRLMATLVPDAIWTADLLVSTRLSDSSSHYDSVRALADNLMDFVVFRNVERDVRRGHRPRLK